jgi:hypothetical protein
MSDFLSRLANRKARTPGTRQGFRPGYVIEAITETKTATPNGKAVYGFRFKKQWVDRADVWGEDAAGAAKRAKKELTDDFRAKETARFESEFRGLMECAGVKTDNGYVDLFSYVISEVEAGNETGSGLTPDYIMGSIAHKLAESGKLYAMTAQAQRFEGVTNDHAEMAKTLQEKDLSSYYSGRTKLIPVSSWEEMKDQVPAPKAKPASFDKINAMVSGGGMEDAGADEGDGDNVPF